MRMTSGTRGIPNTATLRISGKTMTYFFRLKHYDESASWRSLHGNPHKQRVIHSDDEREDGKRKKREMTNHMDHFCFLGLKYLIPPEVCHFIKLSGEERSRKTSRHYFITEFIHLILYLSSFFENGQLCKPVEERAGRHCPAGCGWDWISR